MIISTKMRILMINGFNFIFILLRMKKKINKSKVLKQHWIKWSINNIWMRIIMLLQLKRWKWNIHSKTYLYMNKLVSLCEFEVPMIYVFSLCKQRKFKVSYFTSKALKAYSFKIIKSKFVFTYFLSKSNNSQIQN